MNELIQTLIRESWHTTAAHWRALLAGTALSSIVGALAILPMLPLLLTPESTWQPLDAAWRILLVVGLTAAPALVFETWIAGLAEARRNGDAIDHRRIFQRSLRALPAAGGATALLYLGLFALVGVAMAMAPLFLTAHLGTAATVVGLALFFACMIAFLLAGFAMPGILSVACAVAYAEDEGPLGSFRRTLRIFSSHGRAALNLSLVGAILASVLSIPLVILLLPLAFLSGIAFSIGNALTAAGLVALMLLAVVALHGAHTAQSVVTSHIYPVMRHFGRVD